MYVNLLPPGAHPFTALNVAFEALEAMREKAPAGEEAVYRSLISACGRCGNSKKTMAVVEVCLSFITSPLACTASSLAEGVVHSSRCKIHGVRLGEAGQTWRVAHVLFFFFFLRIDPTR